MASASEVLHALRAAGRRRPSEGFALRIDGRPPDSRPASWLPAERDVSVRGYVDRLRPRLEDGRLSVFVRHFEVDLGWDPWERFRRFLLPVYAACGAPTDRAEVDLFLGDYAATPGGVHADAANVFCFIVEGRKRFRLWPPEALRDRPHTTRIAAHGSLARRSICLDAEPGDIVYWPPGYWHVGEPKEPGASLSLALYEADAGTDTIERRPTDVATVRAAMDRATGLALEVPPPEPVRLHRRDTVRGTPGFPILHRRIGGTAIVSANGRSRVLPAFAGLGGLLRLANEEGPHPVGEMIELGSRGGSSHAPRVRALLRFLIGQRALRLC
jgi:hypothetical protein